MDEVVAFPSLVQYYCFILHNGIRAAPICLTAFNPSLYVLRFITVMVVIVTYGYSVVLRRRIPQLILAHEQLA